MNAYVVKNTEGVKALNNQSYLYGFFDKAAQYYKKGNNTQKNT